MNDNHGMTSQPDPGKTLRDERTSLASRFPTSLLLQHAGRAKTIFSNLKDLLMVRSPKLAHSSAASRTITLKDENFSRSQIASFALHGSLALLLFMSFVTNPQIIKKIPDGGLRRIFAPPPDYLTKLLAPRPQSGDHGAGSGGERNPIPPSSGDRPPVAREQIVAPSVHAFPNAALQVIPILEGPVPMPSVSKGLPNWGDIKSDLSTDSNGSGCCQGIGNHNGTGIGPGGGPGAGPGHDRGGGFSPLGPPGNGVSVPSCLYCPKPEYSDEARKVHFQGLVELSVVVLADGKPGRIELIRGAGMGLDEKAIEAVRNWRFKPAIGTNGRALAVIVPIEVQFQLF